MLTVKDAYAKDKNKIAKLLADFPHLNESVINTVTVINHFYVGDKHKTKATLLLRDTACFNALLYLFIDTLKETKKLDLDYDFNIIGYHQGNSGALCYIISHESETTEGFKFVESKLDDFAKVIGGACKDNKTYKAFYKKCLKDIDYPRIRIRETVLGLPEQLEESLATLSHMVNSKLSELQNEVPILFSQTFITGLAEDVDKIDEITEKYESIPFVSTGLPVSVDDNPKVTHIFSLNIMVFPLTYNKDILIKIRTELQDILDKLELSGIVITAATNPILNTSGAFNL